MANLMDLDAAGLGSIEATGGGGGADGVSKKEKSADAQGSSVNVVLCTAAVVEGTMACVFIDPGSNPYVSVRGGAAHASLKAPKGAVEKDELSKLFDGRLSDDDADAIVGACSMGIDVIDFD